MSVRLAELQKSDDKIQKIRVKGLDKYKEIKEILHYQGLLFLSKIIQTELISRHHDNSFAR